MKQAKNAVERHVIWSDIHLDLDDWRDFLMENYPDWSNVISMKRKPPR